ncbi:MAG: glycoside hydrolase family 88 protein [Defluviitaleaceae bacterium]|nr:glycoside hydrolase family 88 protein [Defluviitaleaceae bacterium]MCL2835909.1 glycoside hydrolase family 88 protein [Defluviitaleaceae bacterium]
MDHTIIEQYINRLVTEGTPEKPLWNIEREISGKPPHWNYIDGCFLLAVWELHKKTGDKQYADFCDRFMDFYINDDGIPLGYTIETYNLDNICPGRVLFDLYAYSGREKYAKAIELLASQLDKQPRTYEGSFWHKAIYPHQVWLDGLYMAQVFRARYAQAKNRPELLDDMINQFNIVRHRMYDESTGLYRHGYDAEKSVFWADKNTGMSPNVWLRSLGWFVMSMADTASYLDNGTHKGRLIELLNELLGGIARYADPDTGLYYQVTDQIGRDGNYPESSGSSMIAYTMMKAARYGFADRDMRQKGLKTFNGVCRKFLTEKKGQLNLGGICLSAGLGPVNNPIRDGSFEYYISEPIVENDAKGVAPFLMSYMEVLYAGGE